MGDAAPDGRGEERETAWLVLRAQAGDRPALESVLHRAHAVVRRWVQAMARDDDLADDVLQEILLVVFRKLGSLREPRAFTGWVRRIASRELFRALRAQRESDRTHEILHEERLAAPDEVDARELLDRLPTLLDGVSPASRAVLTLHYLEGLTLDEISIVLELPMGTVKSRLAYGLENLRRELASRKGARR